MLKTQNPSLIGGLNNKKCKININQRITKYNLNNFPSRIRGNHSPRRSTSLLAEQEKLVETLDENESDMDRLKQRSFKTSKRSTSSEINENRNNKFADALHTKPFQFSLKSPLLSYNNSELFSDAIELYNRKNLRLISTEEEKKKFHCEYYWECKGSVCAGQQLCTGCRDYGKKRNFKEFYYVDIIEVSQYRKILCQRCMEYLLIESLGIDKVKVESELKELRYLQGAEEPKYFIAAI